MPQPTFGDAIKAQIIESMRAKGIVAPTPCSDALAYARSLHEDEHTEGAERAECAAILRSLGLDVTR